MRVNFLYRHFRDTVVIMEEGNLPHPRFPRCDMLVPWKSLNGRHTTTAHFAKGVERKSCWLVAKDMRESATRSFRAYIRPLEMVSYFK